MKWCRFFLLGLAIQFLAAGGAFAGGCAASATSPDYKPGTVSPMLFGTHLLFNQVTDRLRTQPGFTNSLLSVPIHSLRFPGGGIGDNYLWEKKQTARQDWFPFNHKASANDLDFDEFMSVAKCLGAQPSIVLNLRYWLAAGKLDEGMAEAEDWVRYANKEKDFGIRYWELGNEVYGNKKQSQSAMTAREYGKYYAEFRRRLKSIDPSVELGLVLPAATDTVAAGDTENWWNGALEGAGGQVDYVAIHRYVVMPPRALERKGSTYDDTLAAAREKLKAVIGKEVPIHLTEWNIGHKSVKRDDRLRPATIGYAMFIADALVDQAEYGVRFATFWPLLGPNDLGFMNKSDVSLNVPGRVMHMMSGLAGWQVSGAQRHRKGLQWSLYRGPDGRMGAVLINWKQDGTQFDWPGTVGSCEFTSEIMTPDTSVGGGGSIQSRISGKTDPSRSGTVELPGYSVAVVLSKAGQKCMK